MPQASANGIQLTYETFGDPADKPVLLVMGLGAQMISWDEAFCALMVARGHYVIRYDNRDVGSSTWIDAPDFDMSTAVMSALGGDISAAPYLLSDMAADAVGLIDHLGLEKAHLVGASMGGMIAQLMAIEYPGRVSSITSIMSTTGDHNVGAPDDAILGQLLEPRPSDPSKAIEFAIELNKLISSPDHWTLERARARAEAEFARGVNPDGVARQLLAILSSGSREEGLARLDLPALVVHGRQDPLVNFSGGQRTAELIAGADFLAIDDMGHDVPLVHYPRITDAIAAVIARAK